jgi:hypothetical protein
VAYISLDAPCSAAAAAAALPRAPASFRKPELLLRDKLSCRSDAAAMTVDRCSALLALLVPKKKKGYRQVLSSPGVYLGEDSRTSNIFFFCVTGTKKKKGVVRCYDSLRAVVSAKAPDDRGAIGCR